IGRASLANLLRRGARSAAAPAQRRGARRAGPRLRPRRAEALGPRSRARRRQGRPRGRDAPAPRAVQASPQPGTRVRATRRGDRLGRQLRCPRGRTARLCLGGGRPLFILPPSPDYTDKDFDSLRARLIALIRSVFPDWSDFSGASFGNVLLEMYAFVGDII